MDLESFCSPYWVRNRTELKQLRTFDYQFFGGVFTGFKNTPYYLVKQDEPIPFNLLRKTHVTLAAPRPKTHPLTGHLINYGQIPFGYKDINGTLHEGPVERFVLQQMRRMRDDGDSPNKIANYLTKSGVPTKNGGRWQSNTVNKILSRDC
jgi:hypothetical protein